MRIFFGGDKRVRTADLLTASQALSQLSYTPMRLKYCITQNAFCKYFFKFLIEF